MNAQQPMGVLHSFSIKIILHDKIDLRLFLLSFDDILLCLHPLNENLISLEQSEIFSISFHIVINILTPSSLMSDYSHVQITILVRLLAVNCRFSRQELILSFFKFVLQPTL